MLYPFTSRHTTNGVSVRNLVPGSAIRKRVLAALLVLFAPAVVPAHANTSCRIPGGRTIATGATAKLIAIPTPGGSALYACIRRSGRKIALDYNFSDARVSGRWVAWQRRGHGDRWRIVVDDLRTSRERFVVGRVARHSLVLTARGTIVWAQLQDASPLTPLYANDARTGGRLLDGGAVEARSVRLAGRRVSWISDGQRRAARVR